MAEFKMPGDVRVTGDLRVDGGLPDIARSDLTQDPEAVFTVPWTSFRVHDALHTSLPGTSAADDLALEGGTPGTDAPNINTGDVKASTVSRKARFQFELPAEYDDGQTIKLRLNAGMETTVADTSATVDVNAYVSDRDGTSGSDICTTAAQDINSLTFADQEFGLTPTGLSSGDVIDIVITVAVTDSATGTAVQATIGAVEMLVDIKG